MREYPRLMLAAAASGSGKTVITCGLLQALLNRSLETKAFKCGPDYIDPMFHRYVLGVEGGNLDTYFLDKDSLRSLFCRMAKEADLSVIEGVMGYYDGMGGDTLWASSYEVACAVEAPVVLVLDGRGTSLTLAAVLKGLLSYRQDSRIAGVILNRVSSALEERLKPALEGLGVKVYGCLPKCRQAELASRHLGLAAPEEREGLAAQLTSLAEEMETYIDIDGLVELARSAPAMGDAAAGGELRGALNRPACKADLSQSITGQRAGKAALSQSITGQRIGKAASRDLPWDFCAPGRKSAPCTAVRGLRIAVARDEAFSFYYQENLSLLTELGAELAAFSPMRDESLPEGCCGLLLGGGYPELYAGVLASNGAMLCSVREQIRSGLPVLAECGGFLYLHETLEGADGKDYPMAGVIPARAFRADRLSHFGYVELTAGGDSPCVEAGERLKGHEFHYWESTAGGMTMRARKPAGNGAWDCMYAEGGMLAGFPHLYYLSAPRVLSRWLKLCEKWRKE